MHMIIQYRLNQIKIFMILQPSSTSQCRIVKRRNLKTCTHFASQNDSKGSQS